VSRSNKYKAGKNGKQKMTIIGLVAPCDWDQSNNIIAVEIASSGEKTYLVKRDPKGEELFKFIREQIKVIGIVRKDEKGKQIIKVEEYQVMHEQVD
jgi:hypothetical protein